jgi:hypothetical protein
VDECKDDTVTLASETADFTYLIKSPAVPQEVQSSFTQLRTECPFEITISVNG